MNSGGDFTLENGRTVRISDHPLPDGVVDSGEPLTLRELAVAMSVSETTIAKWRALGMPAEKRPGVKGYRYWLAQCWAWKQDRDQQDSDRQSSLKLVAASRAQEFRNLDADQAEAEAELTADEIRKWSEAEFHRNRVAEQRGDLIRADRVRGLVEDMLVSFGSGLDNLPDFAEMNFGLLPGQVAKLQDYCDQIRAEVRRTLEDRVGAGGVVSMRPPRSPNISDVFRAPDSPAAIDRPVSGAGRAAAPLVSSMENTHDEN